MRNRKTKKHLVTVAGVIVIFSCMTFFSSVVAISNSYAEEKTAVAGANKIKSILLTQKEWILEWSCNNGYAGLTDLVFEDRGKKIVVKINNRDYRIKCKRKVVITSDGFKMAGCRQDTTLLVFDPDDERYPFKGDNQNCISKLRVE